MGIFGQRKPAIGWHDLTYGLIQYFDGHQWRGQAAVVPLDDVGPIECTEVSRQWQAMGHINATLDELRREVAAAEQHRDAVAAEVVEFEHQRDLLSESNLLEEVRL